MDIEGIARVAHEVNRAYCQALGDDSHLPWHSAPRWQRDSAVAGVQYHLEHPDADPAASHREWLRAKEAEGWKYGAVKNPDTREHPCFVPFEHLPEAQKAKDYLFRGVVHALASELR